MEPPPGPPPALVSPAAEADKKTRPRWTAQDWKEWKKEKAQQAEATPAASSVEGPESTEEGGTGWSANAWKNWRKRENKRLRELEDAQKKGQSPFAKAEAAQVTSQEAWRAAWDTVREIQARDRPQAGDEETPRDIQRTTRVLDNALARLQQEQKEAEARAESREETKTVLPEEETVSRAATEAGSHTKENTVPENTVPVNKAETASQNKEASPLDAMEPPPNPTEPGEYEVPETGTATYSAVPENLTPEEASLF